MSAPQRFRKKPVEIEAMWWDGTSINGALIAEWCDGLYWAPGAWDSETDSAYISVPGREGPTLASPGYYIIHNGHDEFYPCKHDIFEQTYEPIGGDEK